MAEEEGRDRETVVVDRDKRSPMGTIVTLVVVVLVVLLILWVFGIFGGGNGTTDTNQGTDVEIETQTPAPTE